MVLIKDSGITVLLGIYPSIQAASLISKTIKDRNKLGFYPTIVPTDNACTTNLVEDFLQKLNEKNRKN